MQIRLTVLGPRPEPTGGSPTASDVLVTAPAGTPLAAVAGALAAAAGGAEGPAALYAGRDRLDPGRALLGEPPLTDGAVVSLGAPADPGPVPADGVPQLRVVSGPDAGGVHLLHGGQVRVGRSAQADVPLDDPDVSRLHCAVTLGADGRVTVRDLGSTNGTLAAGTPVSEAPVPLPPGALLRLGESGLRLDSGAAGQPLRTTPDGEGHIRVLPGSVAAPAPPAPPAGPAPHAHGYGPAAWGAASGAADGQAAAPAGPGGSVVPREGADPGPDDTRPGTPLRGTPVVRGPRRRGGLGTWARRLGGRPRGEDEPYGKPPGSDDTGDDGAYPGPTAYGEYGDHGPGGEHTGRDEPPAPPAPHSPGDGAPAPWPDPAELLLTALGPGNRLWERGHGDPSALAVRLGMVERPGARGGAPTSSPVVAGLRETGSLGLAGPEDRLHGLARAVIAQLAALHSPDTLEIVLVSADRMGTDRARGARESAERWAWLGWLPHVRPARGQDCRLLLAHDREQALARVGELLRRLPEPGRAPADTAQGPYSVLVVDGDPGSAAVRDAVARLTTEGPAAGVFVICLARAPSVSASVPMAVAYESACEASPALRRCSAVALLSGDVVTELRLLRGEDGALVEQGGPAMVDAVSAAWADRFARALAPLRPESSPTRVPHTPLPTAARLLDELDLSRATPATLRSRWAAAAQDRDAPGGRAYAVLGAGPSGPVGLSLVTEGPHLLVEGPSGSGRTELLRAVAASLAAGDSPDRLALVLIDGRGGPGGGASAPEGLRACLELPHAEGHLVAGDPLRMREFAQALSAELKRRAEVLGPAGFAEWHTGREVAERLIARRAGSTAGTAPGGSGGAIPASARRGRETGAVRDEQGAADAFEAPTSPTLRLRPGLDAAAGGADEPRVPAQRGGGADSLPSLPRLVVLVDDLDALVAPPLGAPGRPAAGSVVRALEAVAREGERLGVHLVAATEPGGRTAESALARCAALRVTLDAPTAGPEGVGPGRGRLTGADGRGTVFQAGRVTGRIPRTATVRPSVVPLEWERMGDAPARRAVRELGNGPTDLALLASAITRAARTGP
ncbi:FHA domain-containing protein [Streptomyces sp. NPDC050560]|uniref:FHA domain-containing protein n=1 Tax=Streptomyces sp. NPDC050560 TaxID=3365630 RepID=UPI0037A4ABA9